jgi:NAD(P)H-nitrite reductase large subunit
LALVLSPRNHYQGVVRLPTIDRCVCFDKSFVDLQAIAGARGCTSLRQLQEETDFGLACQMCHPYVKRMLRTGETSFNVLLQHHDEPA